MMANDINGGESTELLLRNPDIPELPSPSLAKQMRHGSHAQDYFWPAGIASLTIQVTDGGSGSRSSTATGSAANTSWSNAAPSRSSSATSSSATIPRTLKKARWRTREFLIHYVVVGLALVFMARAAVRLSDHTHANYHIYKHRLSHGWLFGRKVDNSDAQVRQFREGLPSLLGLATAWLICAKSYDFVIQRRTARSQPPPGSPNPRAPFQRIPFILYGGLLVLFLLHGVSALKILGILFANYRITRAFGTRKVAPFIVWTFNLAILFANKIFEGYHYGSVLPFLSILDSAKFAGLVPRWHVIYNISMLRVVSFSMDWYWARKRGLGQPLSRAGDTVHDYSWQNYLAYVLYPPLYIAGPIITFNSFIEQIKKQQRTPLKAIAAYAVRFTACFLTMEVILHYMYVVAIKDSYITREHHGKMVQHRAWHGDTPFELAMISFWNLVIVWLKLLLPWRFFRLWALMDNIDPPENMIRCVLNNYSTRGFWRSWHRSYNLWLLKYVYFPIGSALNTLVALFVVFTFVALWHDLTFQLLAWGWVITLFVLPEYIAMRILPEAKYGDRPWYRHACAVGGIFNVLLMITGNTVGFVLGPENTLAFLKAVFGTLQGVLFLAIACITLFCAVHIMMEYREEELRRGIVRKC